VPDFVDHPKVINGASDLLVSVLGERGKHARSAVGSGSLPVNVAVEVEAVFEVE
jgi:enamine deaminase RidA (YjgF/YER057c/UK114 family)